MADTAMQAGRIHDLFPTAMLNSPADLPVSGDGSPRSATLPAWPSWAVGAVMIALAVGAYGTAALDYRFFVDDHVMGGSLHDPSAPFHPSRQGTWRIIGNLLLAFGLTHGPRVFAAGVVVLHGCNAWLSWRLLCRLGVSSVVALWAAALLAVFPGFHEAVAWISAQHNVLSTTCFLVVLHACLLPATRRLGGVAAVGFGAALLGGFIHDQYSLAYLILPLAAWWMERGCLWPLPDRRRLLQLCAPAVGSGLTILAYLLTVVPTTTKHVGFHPRSLLSSLVYQYLNLAAFDVWLHPIWWRALRTRIATPSGLMLLTLLIGGIVAMAVLVRRQSPPVPGTLPASVRLVVGWALLLLGLASIFVAAGGYSWDSRKRYAFVFLGVLAAGHLLGGLRLRRWMYPAAAATILGTGLTSFALTEARNALIDVKEQLRVEVIRGQVPPGTWIADWDTGPSRLTRFMWTDPREEIWYQSPATGVPPPVVRRIQEARFIIHYDWERHMWSQPEPFSVSGPTNR